jgi:peptidoglycan hydrolase-like protein with peptidoglycan-binding domain
VIERYQSYFGSMQTALQGELTMQSASDATPLTPQATINAQLNKPVLRRGSKGKDVEERQKLLTLHKTFTGPINGSFGPQTEKGVIDFQHRVFLVEDGIVGKLTWQALYSGAPVNMPVLKRGSKGEAVITLQRVLQKSRDPYTGSLDGDFGSRTETAVKAFQKRSELPEDGVVADRTWHALSKVPH